MPDDMNAIRDLASALAPTAPTFEPVSFRKGTVTAVNVTVPPTISVTLAGNEDVVVEEVGISSSYAPQVNDVVILAKSGPSMVAIGAASTTGGWVQATLAANWAHVGDTDTGPVEYRLVYDQGSWKMEWRGGAAYSGPVNPSSSTIVQLSDPRYFPQYKRNGTGQRNSSNINAIRLQATNSGVIQGGGLSSGSSTGLTWVSLDGWSYYL